MRKLYLELVDLNVLERDGYQQNAFWFTIVNSNNDLAGFVTDFAKKNNSPTDQIRMFAWDTKKIWQQRINFAIERIIKENNHEN